jgi:hypothetical protein
MNNEQIIAETVIKLGKTDTELNNVKSDLTDTKIDLANKLEVTKKELAKIKNITGNFSTELKGKSIIASKRLTMKLFRNK